MNATIQIKSQLQYNGKQVITVYRLIVNGTIYATYATQAEADRASQYVR